MTEKTAHTEMDLELMMESSDLSKAEYNFVCVTRVCKDVIKLPLIDVSTQYISPNELYKKIRSCSMLFTEKNKLNPDQLKCCFLQPPLLPDYKTFDFPLLYKLIRHLCPSLRPTQGWGIEPKRTDTLIGDDIERLRLFSIYMIDCSTRMSDGKFEEFFNSVRYGVRRFQNFTKNWSNYNYEEELKKIVPKKLGHKHPKKEEQLENVQLTIMQAEFSDLKDEPVILIDGAEEAKCGSTVQFNVNVKPANNSDWSVNWQKNRTGATELIDITSRKYSGSHNRQLVINCVEKEDEGKYQAFLSRESNGKIYKIFSNCINLLPRKGPPYVLTRHISDNKNRSVRLIGEVFGTDQNSTVHTVYWSKNGEKIDTHAGERMYVRESVKYPSLTIHNVNYQDIGSYRLTAIGDAGSNESEIVFGVPNICIERREYPDGSRCFTAKIKSIPEAYHVQWKVKRNGDEKFSLIDIHSPEYKGTSNSLHCPVLVVKKKEQMENKCFHIKVDNFIGSSIQEIFCKNIEHI